jgi:hypothetical protein
MKPIRSEDNDMLTTPLKLLPATLKQRTGRTPPKYFQCYHAILDARIPAHKVSGKWHVNDSDLPLVERVFGLAPADPSDTENAASPPVETSEPFDALMGELQRMIAA